MLTKLGLIAMFKEPPNMPVDTPSLIETIRKFLYEAPTKSQFMQNIEKELYIHPDQVKQGITAPNPTTWVDGVTNQITESLTDKMDMMINQSTDKITLWYQGKLDSLLEWLKVESLDIIQIGFVCYIFYLCFRLMFKAEDTEKNYTSMYLSVMAYTIARLFYKVTFSI